MPTFSAPASLTASRSLGDRPSSLTIANAIKLLHSGRLRCVDLVRDCLAEVTARNGALKALVTLDCDATLKEAAEADDRRTSGRPLPSLHGIPISLKDNIDTADIRTTAGSAVFADRVPSSDAEVVRRLKCAGAIIMGKCNMQEFALGPTSTSSMFGAVRNPRNPDYSAGGSSGGSAAAIAANMSMASIGTDTGGSLRNPSAFCGVVGFKPTHGLVPMKGIVPVVRSLDHCGTITKCVEDARLVLAAIAGFGADKAENFGEPTPRETRNLTLGIPENPFLFDIDPQIVTNFDLLLRQAGLLVGPVKTIEYRFGEEIDAIDLEIEQYAYHAPLFADFEQKYTEFGRISTRIIVDKYEQRARDGINEAKIYMRVRKHLEALRQRSHKLFVHCDVVMVPTMRILPWTIVEAIKRDAEVAVHNSRSYSNGAAFNYLGLPAITIPCGFANNGLPLGVTIAAPQFHERQLLAFAAALERSLAFAPG
ncbi:MULTISPECIES: amidase [unclassified Sphingobium]|uniref:amidase n=1 Tax=unclassified Sphingobium TaxID=2611147 RepID=UPI001E59A3BD|nr:MULTISPECIES: amidase [unclassified Sphingobium]